MERRNHLAAVRKTLMSYDDTGVCELLCIGCEIKDNNLYGSLEDRHSPEIPYVPEKLSVKDFVSEQIAEETSKVKNKQLVKTNIPDPVLLLDNEQRSSNKSLLTLLLEKSQSSGNSEKSIMCSEFSVFDGRSDRQCKRGLLSIWLWNITGLPRCCVKIKPTNNATVHQCIGLALWQHNNESESDNAEFKLLPLDNYKLYMLDNPEEGLDSEFPALNEKDLMSKYQFDCLALVEIPKPKAADSEKQTVEQDSVLVMLYMAQGVSCLRFNKDDTLNTVLEKAVSKRQLRQPIGYKYHLELWNESIKEPTNNYLDSTLSLRTFVKDDGPVRFLMIRENSKWSRYPVNNDDETSSDINHYRQFRGVYLCRAVINPEIVINITNTDIEISPVQMSKKAKLFVKPAKPITLPLTHVLDCDFYSSCNDVSEDDSKKIQFTLNYLPFDADLEMLKDKIDNQFIKNIQRITFETQWSKAKLICNYVNSLSRRQLCNGLFRDYYQKEKWKLYK